MSDPKELKKLQNEWERWLSILKAAHDQVCRSLEPSSNTEGECYLSIIATTMVLEAFMNNRSKTYEPKGFEKVFRSKAFSVPDRYRFVLRLFQKPKDVYEQYEQLEVHGAIAELFADRNKIVHGDVKRMHEKQGRINTIRTYWNSALDLIYHLEAFGSFGVPMSRLEDFKQELDNLRV